MLLFSVEGVPLVRVPPPGTLRRSPLPINASLRKELEDSFHSLFLAPYVGIDFASLPIEFGHNALSHLCLGALLLPTPN